MKQLPLDNFLELAERFGTPLWIYHSPTICDRIAELRGFDVIRYAQKANNNIAILDLMRRQGVVVDAVSGGEIHRALLAGFKGGRREDGVSEIVYTADLFDEDALRLVAEHQITVNVGSPDMIDQLAERDIHVPLVLRVNPGFGHGHSQKVNTGGPLSKHGIWHEDLPEVLANVKTHQLELLGLHLHIGSGSDLVHLAKVADAMEALIKDLNLDVEMVSAGGGIPVPYREGQERISIEAFSTIWYRAKERIEQFVGHDISLEIEPGRYLVAESGYLVTQIRSIKSCTDLTYYIVDAGFDTLMRPAMYGAYHTISVIPQDGSTNDNRPLIDNVIVAGPLCESCDVFTQEEGGIVVPRQLPEANVGDFVVLHTAGAYGAAMSSNYNSRLLAPEVMIDERGVHLIRERQQLSELTARERIP